MRSRTLKEGSLGLFIFGGLVLFILLIVWLTGATFGKKTYTIAVRFDNANAMQEGAIVRYRGLEVGRITAVMPSSNGVEIEIEIQAEDLVIPRDVIIEANQGGLIGETSIEITPQTELSTVEMALDPFERECESQQRILCDGTILDGVVGVSFEQVLRNTTQFSSLYGDPEFVEAIQTLMSNSSDAAAQVAILTQELSLLSEEVRGEVGNFAENAQAITNSAVSSSSQLNRTLEQVDSLTRNLDGLIVENRQALVGTLNSISRTSEQMQGTLASFGTTLNTVNQNLDSDQTQVLLDNLSVLTANAATASENLKDISTTFNDPETVVMLQQTLDAARVTFENTQKITSDLDELTGDPQFRKNLIDLVNGLSQLVSSTDQLQQQVQTASRLEHPQAEAFHHPPQSVLLRSDAQQLAKDRDLN